MADPFLTDDDFLGIADLAALAAPAGAAEREALLRAHEALAGFATEVKRLAEAGSAERETDVPECPLRADEPGPGIPIGTTRALAPEIGDRRLIRVPGVL